MLPQYYQRSSGSPSPFSSSSYSSSSTSSYASTFDLSNVVKLTKRRLYKRYQHTLRTWHLERPRGYLRIAGILGAIWFVLYMIYLLRAAPSAEPVLPREGEDHPTLTVPNVPLSNPITTNADRQEAVKQAFLHAWNGYKKYAFGHDEIRPVTNETNDSWNGWGVTLVDGLDTMLLMGLRDEFELATRHVESILFIKDYSVSVFETVIRYVGGFLGAYTLSEDELFLSRAKELTDLLMPSFDSPTGIPYHKVNLKTGVAANPTYTGDCSVLSEIGSVQVELKSLSSMTGIDTYGDKAQHVLEVLRNAPKTLPVGLYPTFINPKTGEYCNENVSFGALGDSFYEYLLKMYLLTGDEQLRKMYEESADALRENLIVSFNSWTFVSETSGLKLSNVMDHLTCFVPGMLALGAVELNRPDDLELAKKLMDTCYRLYEDQPTHIGPERVEFDANTRSSSKPYRIRSPSYLLRPETLESLFVLYRVTGESKYQDQAWSIFQGIEKHCRTYAAYSGLKDVTRTDGEFNNSMQSFFLAETLKYLYLIFGPVDVLPLSEYVFNTEAHPLKRLTS